MKTVRAFVYNGSKSLKEISNDEWEYKEVGVDGNEKPCTQVVIDDAICRVIKRKNEYIALTH